MFRNLTPEEADLLLGICIEYRGKSKDELKIVEDYEARNPDLKDTEYETWIRLGNVRNVLRAERAGLLS